MGAMKEITRNSAPFSDYHRYLRYSIIAEMIALVAAGVSTAFLPGSLRSLTLGLAIMIISGVILFFIWLLGRYRSLGVVKEKESLSSKISSLQRDLRDAQSRHRRAKSSLRRTLRKKEREIAKRQRVYDQLITRLKAREKRSYQEGQKEITQELDRFQKQHFREGMNNALISKASIAGVGPKLKERLASRGVTRASDVRREAVIATPGFGEVKASVVLDWRRQIEDDLRRSSPNQLPSNVEKPLRTKYRELREAIKAEEIAATEDLSVDLERIRRDFESKFDAIRQEISAIEIISRELKVDLDAARSELKAFDQVRFSKFIELCLSPSGEGGIGNLKNAGIVTALIVGFLWQMGSAAGSVGALVQASIPTPTSTPTITPTFTSTATVTPSPTPTDTLTPTITQTPTITLTPTITMTPSITPTPSITTTPTPKVPAVSGSACVPEDTNREVARVISVIDGDTIRVSIDGLAYTVRYIGIDAPDQGERYFYGPFERNMELLSGETVILVRDTSETDDYSRLLRYVFVEDSFINYTLVREGYAISWRVPPDVACSDTFQSAQGSARAARLGLWEPTSTPYPTSPPAPTDSGGGGQTNQNCHPSYPDVCIPRPPPDLDCKDIPYSNFRVVGKDPHRFDGDNDGYGCEG